MNYPSVLVTLAVIASQLSPAQTNQRLAALAKDYTVNDKEQIDFIRLKEANPVYEINSEAFLNSTVLSNGCKAKKYKTESDPLGFTHERYQVIYNSIPVHNMQLITHARNGKLVSLSGDLNEITKPVNSISLSEKTALQKALAKVNAQQYKWENKKEEAIYRTAFNTPDFTFYPKGELILFPKGNTFSYAYKFVIYADVPLYGANVIVDAQNGTILAEENLIHTADVPATCITKFSGAQSFTVDNVSAGLYRLSETGRGLGIETLDLNTSTNYGSAIDYTNTSVAWTNTTTIDQVGTDCHWGAEMVYDYFLTDHSRNSIDGAGFKLISFADYGVGYANAMWNGFVMTYGSGSSGGFTGLDICGHEVSHGLTSKTAGLIYQNESGALNESYSDIFGRCIENFGRPSNTNWLIGEDVGGIRNMANPSAMGDPDTYLGTNWYSGTGDNGGVHTNSGVSNYWFYLLSQGATGTNDLNYTFTVTGIGMSNAAKIAFRALTVYYGPNTNYPSARNLSVQAAIDLFGACSNEVYQTKNAWYACGVGPAPSGTATPVADFFAITSSPCALPHNVNFYNSTYGGDTYKWDFGDGSSLSAATSPVHTYTANGTYNVKLVATSSCAATPDSIIKSSFIVINSPAPSTATGSSGCVNTSMNLSASGGGQQYWYTSSTATGTPLYIGNTFSTPTLTNTTTYYVVNTFTNPPLFGGPPSTTIGTGANYPGYTPYDSLTVLQPCKLKTVMVSASSTANRTIELRDKMNAVIMSTVVNIPSGVSTVTLNFDLTPGYGYRLGLGSGTAQLYRNNGGVTYPYNIGGYINITGSSQGPNYFFFFYNWEVEPGDCKSSATAVTASITPGPTVNLSVQSVLVCKDDSLVALNGSPSGGTYSGTGVTGNNFNPGVGQGAYNVYYTYTDGNQCSNTDSVTMVVGLCSGINELNNSGAFVIYPNPVSEYFTIQTDAQETFILRMTDATGKTIVNKQLSGKINRINMDGFAKGIYLIEVQDASSNIYHQKLIKQ